MKWERPRRLIIVDAVFQCPYCDKQWGRGGHKEGFVKAAADAHVFTCFEVYWFRQGQTTSGKMRDWMYEMVPLSESKYPGDLKRLRRADLKRKAAGK